jgi:RNA polymerase sigma-70 factor (ECF subfamily)
LSIAVPLGKGDESAADAAALLYQRHAARIFTFCLRRLRSREEAEDAVQQTFLKALAAMRGGFRPNAERAWLYRIAENVCADRLRVLVRRVQHEAADVDELVDVLPAQDAHPRLEGLDQALLALTPPQRRALLLREWQGMSYNEIARELELSESAVETLLFRARRSLARRLESQRAALRGWAADAGALAAWLKSALAGGTAVKAATVVAAAGGLGAAAAGPIVLDDRRTTMPAAPAPARPPVERTVAATDRPARERARAAVAKQPRATDAGDPHRIGARPAPAPQPATRSPSPEPPSSSAPPVPQAAAPASPSAAPVPVPEPKPPAPPAVITDPLPIPELAPPELRLPDAAVPELPVPELASPLLEVAVDVQPLAGLEP